ncbi:peptidylprolyl isomerase [Marinobacter zhejiangensis]|uniref:Chaperone SurA n=1 Tax=Marinobacter zhejiangensis TaxID=488535 RepID=A0A1I4L1F1_9GAMM|nr:peptidylprolyl isomerase [Marinobacter zhejiangensis]SFL84850.1 peptidyl-prolyl cis-trans isomerase SurA [Marinobacter zhejiangensis]
MKVNLRTCVQAVMVVMAMLLVASAQAARQPLERVIAIVDDGVILQTELDARIRTITSRLTAQGTALPPRHVLEERVLDQMITDTIQFQLAERMGMRISDNELNETIRSIATNNNLTMAQFEQQLTAEGLTYAAAREQIRQEMLLGRIQQRSVGNRIRVTDREVETYLAAAASQGASGAEYQLAHILVAVDNFNDADEVAQAEAKAQRLLAEIKGGKDFRAVAVAESDASNALEGGVMGWRPENQLPSLVADIVPGMALQEPSDVLRSGSGFHIITVLAKRGGGEQLVEQHKVRHILIRPTETVSNEDAQAHSRDIYQQLQDGADFAALAKDLSDDPVSGSAGGDLGWVSRGQMVPEFEQAMLEARIGELKGPFRSQFGWHILQVQERRQKDISDEVQANQARQAIYMRKFDVELQAWLREIRDEAFVELKVGNEEGADS